MAADANRIKLLKELLAERILVLDGAFGTFILDHHLSAADYLGERYKVSQRRISRVMARSRSILRYRCRRGSDDQPLIREIKRLARRHPRLGFHNRRYPIFFVHQSTPMRLKRELRQTCMR